MTKDEIRNKIISLKSDNEIKAFVESRIAELENNSVEATVGQGYTDSFSEYISDKVHYKAAAKIKDKECPDLVYDDLTPYYNLVKELNKNGNYAVLTLFTTIFYIVNDYLPSDDIGWGRALTYFSHQEKHLSIKTIRENGCAFCSEKAGMAHNLFKFLGIDSEVICGARGKDLHAFNMIYPNGYGNEPMILYDPSFFVDFIKNDKKISLGYFKAFKKEDYESFKQGIPTELDLSKTELNYRRLYGNALDGYEFKDEHPVYVYGLDASRNYIDSLGGGR